MEITKELADACKKEHQTFLTTFEVKVGKKVDRSKRYCQPIESLEDENGSYFWTCYRWEDLKKEPYLYGAYKKLMHNFRVDTAEFDDSEGFEYMWLLFCSTLKPGLLITGDFYPVGMFGIVHEPSMHGYPSYTGVWVHPYMRGRGMVKGLLYHLMKRKLHLPQPPVTTAMNFAIDSVQKMLSVEVSERLNMEGIDYMEKMNKVDLSGLSKLEISLLTTLLPVMPDDNKNQETIDELINMLRDKNVMEELRKIDLSGFSREDLIKQRGDMMNMITANKGMEKKGGK